MLRGYRLLELSRGPQTLGYRTLRVAGVLTFRCAGAGKSVFSLVGTNYEDGQIVLLAG